MSTLKPVSLPPTAKSAMPGAQITSNHHFEAVDLFSGTTVASVLYTLVVVLYCFSSSLTYSQIKNLRGKIPRGTVLTFVLATLMMVFATMDVTLLNLQRRITYVDYGTLPGGPLALPASLHASTVIKLSLVTRLVEKLLIIAVMVSLSCLSFWYVHFLTVYLDLACFRPLDRDSFHQARYYVNLYGECW
jgi:amino acid transporter